MKISAFVIFLFIFGVVESSVLFQDDFENGLSKWEITKPDLILTIDSGDPSHDKVLRMRPGGENVLALMKGSEKWAGYRMSGEIYFPASISNYFGIIYNYHRSERRTDFGSIYIKGNDSYIRVNPRYDWNPARMIFEEFKTPLTGDDAIVVGKWQRFAAEVIRNVCHFYVGNMKVPKVTLDLYERNSGKAGIKPRVVGGDVWADNMTVSAIEKFSYSGPSLPSHIQFNASELITKWWVLGPFRSAQTDVEAASSRKPHPWVSFPVDKRGALMTGRIVEFLGDRTVAYFSTTITVEKPSVLQLSTIDNLALWNNTEFLGYADRDEYAWYDFGRNPKHPPTVKIELPAGTNHILIRVRGGQYATGGFFARLEN